MSDRSSGDVAVGDSTTRTVEDLSRTDIVRYVGASGEFNPIHYDEPFAKRAGHSSVFANGMLIAGIASTVLCGLVPLAAVRSFETRFTSPVWPGDDVTVRAEVTDLADSDPVATVSLRATNQASEEVLDGEATVEYR